MLTDEGEGHVAASVAPRVAQNTMRGFRYLVFAAALMTYLLIVIGGIVRVTGSGLGCPDWPTCYGRWIPPLRMDALLEYAHRLIAALTSPLIVAATVGALLHHRAVRWSVRPLAWAVGLLVAQVLLGGVTVILETPPEIVALHLGLALAILALVFAAAVFAWYRHYDPHIADQLDFSSRFARLTLWTSLATFIALVSGALVAGSGATAACVGWPLCNGLLWPTTLLGRIHMVHRLLVALNGALMAWLLVRAWRGQRQRRAVLTVATVTVVLFGAQVLVGAFKTAQGFPVYLLALHVATASAVWASLIVLAMLIGIAEQNVLRPLPATDFRAARLPRTPQPRARDFLLLTKPVIVLLLSVTVFAGLIVGGQGWPSPALLCWTLLGHALGAGGAGALNQYIDRELDHQMPRTARRPLPAGRLYPAEALAFGVALCLSAFYLTATFVNLTAALLLVGGMLYYVLIYSLLLKRSTAQNVVIGGVAGALPPLVGWSAATGGVSGAALALFAIIFFWTPLHTWSLALVRCQEYARVGVPMLPVVRGEQATRRKIMLYTLGLVALTWLLPLLRLAGAVYAVPAVLLGSGLLWLAGRLWQKGGEQAAAALYRYSSLYLGLLLLALVADVLL